VLAALTPSGGTVLPAHPLDQVVLDEEVRAPKACRRQPPKPDRLGHRVRVRLEQARGLRQGEDARQLSHDQNISIVPLRARRVAQAQQPSA